MVFFQPCRIIFSSSPMGDRSVLVIGVGNRLRGDDGASWEVLRQLRKPAAQVGVDVGQQLSEPTDLLEAWQGRDAVVIVDTTCSDESPGTISRFDVSIDPLPARQERGGSTHAFGLHEAIELGRVMDRLPRRLIVFGVEGRAFGAGTGLSGEVAAAVAPLVDAVLAEARELARG
jgi:hydrogenase maturation protease